MTSQAIGPRVTLSQPFICLPEVDVMLWLHSEDDPAPLSLLLDFGNAKGTTYLSIEGARNLRDLLSQGLEAAEIPLA